MAGLILAMVATALIAYAVPSWVDRRYAVVTSREGDRFSESLTLLEPTYYRVTPAAEPSSRPLLARIPGPEGTESQMSEEKTSSRPASTAGKSAALGSRHAHEYAALRAKRASRLSIETAAAQRRLVTAGVAAALTVLFGVLAAFSVMAWVWILLPLAFLGGTLAASVLAGGRAKKAEEYETQRLAHLREAMGGSEGGRNSRPARKPSVASVEKRIAEKTSAIGKSNADVAEHQPGEASEIAVKTSAELAKSLRSQAGPVVANDQEGQEALRPASGGEWDYVPMPDSLHAKRPSVKGRVVRTHTDIKGVRRVEPEAAVPGRPVRKTHAPMSIEEIETSSNPTFRFDLDAVLDQRRAQ